MFYSLKQTFLILIGKKIFFLLKENQSTLYEISQATTQTTKLTTTTTQTKPPLTSLNLTKDFYFDQINANQAVELLNSDYDLNSCLLNCSKRGACYLKGNSYCSCNSKYITGKNCEIDTRPCALNSCLNNSTCVDFTNSNNYNISLSSNSSYKCKCNSFHYGEYCEIKVDICRNETCSGNGNCLDENNSPKCKCFNLFYGEKCEFESAELRTAKSIITFASVTALITIFLFYGIIAFLDILKYFFKVKLNGKSLKKIRDRIKKNFKPTKLDF